MLVLFLREMKPKKLFSGHKHGKMRTKHNWLSFFVIPLSSNQTTAKKEEKAEYENHTHFKYDSQININHWPTDGKDIHHVRKSS